MEISQIQFDRNKVTALWSICMSKAVTGGRRVKTGAHHFNLDHVVIGSGFEEQQLREGKDTMKNTTNHFSRLQQIN